jgi:hypothetical protein
VAGIQKEAGSSDRVEETSQSFWDTVYHIAFANLGLMPDQLDRLTPGELSSLQEHWRLQHEWEREQAAFSGYCAGLAFAMAWNGDLKGFDKFFIKPVPNEPPPKSRVEKFRDDCKLIGLKAGQLTDGQLALT